MTPERAHAYRRVMQTLDEVGPAKLHADEQDRLRHAADCLLFSRGLLADEAAREAMEDTERLCRALVESGRWQRETAMALADDVAQCGPVLPFELDEAA